MLFISANSDIAIRRYCNFLKKSRYQLCHFSLPIELDSSKSIKQINVVVSWVLHSAKSGTIDILTYFGKIAISPDCNIQIGWNKRGFKSQEFIFDNLQVSCLNYVLFTSNDGNLSLHNFFSDTGCYFIKKDVE